MFKSPFASRVRATSSRQRRRVSLSLEPLERREVLSTSYLISGYSDLGDPYVATNSSGDTIAVWDKGDGDVYYENVSSGSPGTPVDVTNNGTSGTTSGACGVGVDGSGGFVVLFFNDNPTLGTDGFAMQRFNSSGSAVGGQVGISHPGFNPKLEDVAMNSSGQFVIGWSAASGGSEYSAYVSEYAEDGSVEVSPIRVFHASYFSNSSNTTVGIDSSGNFVVGWEQEVGTGMIGDPEIPTIDAQLYGSDGTAATSVFQVNSGSITAERPSVKMNASGAFVFTWVEETDPGMSDDIYSVVEQQYSSDATTSGDNYTFYTGGSGEFISNPCVAIDSSGAFAITFADIPSGATANTIYAAVFDSSGDLSDTYTVSTHGDAASDTELNFNYPHIAMDDDGHITVTWLASGGTYPGADGWYN